MLNELMGFTVVVSDITDSHNCKAAMSEITLPKLCEFEF